MADAKKEFEEALRLRPDYAKARNGMGAVYFRSREMPEAAREFEEALKADPSLAEAHLNLGVALSRMGRVAEAISQCQEALRLRPSSPPPARLCDNCRPGCARTEASPSPRGKPSLQSLAPWLMISAPGLDRRAPLLFPE